MRAKYTKEQVAEAIAMWESVKKDDPMAKKDDITENSEEIVHEMDVSLSKSKKYPPNTVGALIALLKSTCDMNDVLMPRVKKEEHFIFDLYSRNGKCIIDLVKGNPDR